MWNDCMKTMPLRETMALLFALLGGAVDASEATVEGLPGAAHRATAAIDIAQFDTRVRPQDDFVRYVNGKWLAAAVIPPDKSSYGAWDKVSDQTELRLRGLIEKAAAAGVSAGPEARKIGDLYASFMDEKRLQALDVAPLRGIFARIDAVQDTSDVAALIGYANGLGVDAPFTPQIHQDNKDSTKYIVDLVQSGLGLPDRDYYLDARDARLASIFRRYPTHIQKMLTMAGDKSAAADARAIVRLETDLAHAQWTKVENRDPQKTYNKVMLAQLAQLAPRFDWKRYLVAAQFDDKVDYVIVSQPTYITAFANILARTPIPVWKAYFKWQLLDAYAPLLSQRFVAENFAFNRGVVRGTPKDRERWKRAVALVGASMGEALGKLYVAQYFPPEDKARMDAMVSNLLTAYGQSINSLDWMGPDTKQRALDKLAKFAAKIAYPKAWRDYSSLAIAPDDLVGNVMRATAFEYKRNVDKLGKPVDRDEWQMTPQTINAYYDPELNEIVFPAAILQPPFYDPAADDAVNYGAIGAIIGHEISHGFDDQGSQFDGDGNLNNWWTTEDRDEFAAKTKRLVAQYSAYQPLPGYHLNGELTLGENIADNSGLAIAYKAYRLSLGGNEAPVIDGFTGDQRFFIGWTQAWRDKVRDAEIIRRIKIDPHSPENFRARGTLVNQPAFYTAFGIKPGDKMYVPPEKRVIIW
jgi:putative endopeptidase